MLDTGENIKRKTVTIDYLYCEDKIKKLQKKFVQSIHY